MEIDILFVFTFKVVVGTDVLSEDRSVTWFKGPAVDPLPADIVDQAACRVCR
ncbi:hypothetical protein DPMN_082336 [Dreissena polymorpha]|uniref:Uncharacterized protein n=1 Tax=Dreissena polymorpha TaxID=45954 RepID=A0A9D3YAR6_DREPO|nr:hypothetical protein DPMN_082336 [Dreissena polymorpha]